METFKEQTLLKHNSKVIQLLQFSTTLDLATTIYLAKIKIPKDNSNNNKEFLDKLNSLIWQLEYLDSHNNNNNHF